MVIKELGDKQFDDEYTRYNNSGTDIEEGEFVVPTGDEDVALADVAGAGGALIGVAVEDIPNGEYGNVAFGNIRPVRVESGVTAGDELAAPDSSATSGATTPGVAGSGGSSSIYALTDAEADTNGVYQVLAKLS